MLREHYCVVIALEQTPTGDTQRSGEATPETSSTQRGGGATPEKLSNHVVGFFLITDSIYSRNPAARLSESFLVIGKQFRGRGLGREVSTMDLALKKELGYLGSLDDTVLGNRRMLHLFKGNAYSSVTVGVIPDGSVMADGRSEDQVLVLFDIVGAGDNIKTMTVMARESMC